MNNFSKFIGQYIEYLNVEKKASPFTIRNYTHYLHRFLEFLQRHFPTLERPEEINQYTIEQYKVYLSNYKNQKGEGLDLTTQGYHLIALRSLLRYLLKRGFNIINLELISVPHGKARPIKFLDDKQVETLLRLPDSLRDKSIMELLLSTGLRVSDLVRLNKNDIDLGKREIFIFGKTAQKRVVFLTEGANYWLKKYLDERNDNEPALLIRKGGKKGGTLRLTVRSIQRIIEKYVKKAGLSVKATPHTLRHTFAISLLSTGANLRTIQKMLGHKNISTTQIYTHVTNPQLREIHKRFHRR